MWVGNNPGAAQSLPTAQEQGRRQDWVLWPPSPHERTMPELSLSIKYPGLPHLPTFTLRMGSSRAQNRCVKETWAPLLKAGKVVTPFAVVVSWEEAYSTTCILFIFVNSTICQLCL